MSERELVHEPQRCTAQDRNLAARLQRTTPPQFVELHAARRVCKESSGDDSVTKASTRLPEQGTQTPSPAPDLIPAETKPSTEDLHWHWSSKWGHFALLPLSRKRRRACSAAPIRGCHHCFVSCGDAAHL